MIVTTGGRVPLASNRKCLEILLLILRPTTKHYLVQNVNSAKVEKPCLKCIRVTVLSVVENDCSANRYSNGYVKLIFSKPTFQMGSLPTDLFSYFFWLLLICNFIYFVSHIFSAPLPCYPSFFFSFLFLSFSVGCLILPLSFILLSHFLFFCIHLLLPTTFSPL